MSRSRCRDHSLRPSASAWYRRAMQFSSVVSSDDRSRCGRRTSRFRDRQSGRRALWTPRAWRGRCAGACTGGARSRLSPRRHPPYRSRSNCPPRSRRHRRRRTGRSGYVSRPSGVTTKRTSTMSAVDIVLAVKQAAAGGVEAAIDRRGQLAAAHAGEVEAPLPGLRIVEPQRETADAAGRARHIQLDHIRPRHP